jgi:hypothetical protein
VLAVLAVFLVLGRVVGRTLLMVVAVVALTLAVAAVAQASSM